MPIPFALDPGTFATLADTLGPAGALRQAEAAQLEQQKQLQAATAQATQEAQQAQTAYQGAAAAPPPEITPGDQFFPNLLGGIASVVARDPSFRQHAEQEIAGKHRDLMQQRLDNLSALKDVWDKKAASAQRVGDTETELKARMSAEKISKLQQQMLLGQQGEQATALEKLRQQGDIATEKERGRQARLTLAAKPTTAQTGLPLGSTESDYIKLYDKPNPDGTVTKIPYVDISGIKGQKLHDTLKAYGNSQKLPALEDNGDQALKLIRDTRGNIDTITKEIIPHLATGSGLRLGVGVLKKKGEKFFQTPGEGSLLAAYPAYRTAAITTIQTLASLGKGLRINQAEIQAAQNFDFPNINDSQETAANKLAILGKMLGHMEDTILGHPPSQAEVDAVLKEYRQLKAAGKVTNVSVTAPKVIRYDKSGNRLN